MARTQADLAKFVLRDVLSVIDATEAPSAEDDATIDEIYTDLLETLKDEGVADWDINAIPNDAVRSLADVVAYSAGPAFGIPKSSMVLVDRGRTISLEEKGMIGLRRRMSKQSANEPVEAQYF